MINKATGSKGYRSSSSITKKMLFAKHLCSAITSINHDHSTRPQSRSSWRHFSPSQSLWEIGISTKYSSNLILLKITPIRACNFSSFFIIRVEKNDKDNTSYITYEDYPKYMLRTATPLIDLIRKVISDYDRFRKCYFIAYKMETT
jgi:hypothetical protein